MQERRVTRQERGIAQNFANQLAQMAVGMEAMFLGSVLKSEPANGVVELDGKSSSAAINGRAVELALARYVNAWVTAELQRKNLDPTWLKSASVRIQYVQGKIQDAREKRWADFTASARVISEVGETNATFSNSQPLVSGWRRSPFDVRSVMRWLSSHRRR